MTLTFEVHSTGDAAAVRLSGRIDRDAGAALEQAFAAVSDGSPRVLELDFHDVGYINSSGIALIVGVLARARVQGLPLRALGLTAHYQHIFEITRLSDFIEIAGRRTPER